MSQRYHKGVGDNQKMNLKEVHEIFEKWLNFEDTKKLDIMLATALTRSIEGTKIWLIFVGSSGDGKSEMINTLDDGGVNCYIMHRMTSRTLVNGNLKVPDLAPKLNNKIIVISDFAELLTLPSAEKAEIWAQLRELYDGRAGGSFGTGKKVSYSNLNITLMACSTPAIDNQILIHQSLGTRELLYRTKGNKKMVELLRKVSMNEQLERKMKFELKRAIQDFLSGYEYKKELKIDEETEKQLFNYGQYLALMRVQGEMDYSSGEVNYPVYPEQPTRIFKQLKRIYIALMSLDKEYSKKKALSIIKHIVASSGNPLRQQLMEYMLEKKKEGDNPISNSELARILKVNPKTIYKEGNILWNLGILEKDIIYDHYNRPIQHNWSLNEGWEKKYIL